MPRGHGGLLYNSLRSMIQLHSPFSVAASPLRSSSAAAAAMSTTAAAAAMSTTAIDIAQQNRLLRSKIRRELKALPPAQRAHEDSAIQNFVLDSPWFESCRRLCAYISCEALREVDTSRIVANVLRNPDAGDDTQVKKRLYVPRVEDNNSHMRMLNISNIEDLVANSMDILEPSPIDIDGNQREDVMLSSEPVDIFLVPGVAFDRHGRRLGRGGGYYDVLLKKYQNLAMERKWKQPLLVALGYSLQIMEENVIPITPNDVLVDAIVSSSGVIPVSPAALERM